MAYINLKNPFKRVSKSSLDTTPQNNSVDLPTSSYNQENVFNTNVFNTQSSNRFIQPIPKQYKQPKEFNLKKETIRQLPKAIIDTIKDIPYKDKPIPANITDPKKRVIYSTIQRSKDAQKTIKEIRNGFIARGLSIPGEIYALTSDKFEMPSEMKIPFTNETAPTISGIYRHYKELAGGGTGSNILATLATSGVIAGDALILFGGANSLKSKTKLPTTKGQIKVGERVYSNTTELNYNDLVDIIAGRIKNGPKYNAYTEYTREGVNFTKILKSRNTINPKTNKPYTIREAFINGIGDKPGFIEPAEFKGLDIYKGKTPTTKVTGLGAGVSASVSPILAQEALKYKTADEFVKSRKIGFHVTPIKKSSIIDKQGIKAPIGTRFRLGKEEPIPNEVFLWDDITMAKEFKKLKEQEGQKFIIKEVDLTGLKLRKDPEAFGDFVEDVTGNGLIFDGNIPPEIIKTKSQLKDIWNKAHKLSTPSQKPQEARGEVLEPKVNKLSTGEDKLITEAKKYKTADEFAKAQPGKTLYRGGKYGNDIFATPRKELAKNYNGNSGKIHEFKINKNNVEFYTPSKHKEYIDDVLDNYSDFSELEGDVSLFDDIIYKKYKKLIESGKLNDSFDQYGIEPKIDNLFKFLENQIEDYSQFEFRQLSYRDMDGIQPLLEKAVKEKTGKTILARPYDIDGGGSWMKTMDDKQLLKEGDFEYIIGDTNKIKTKSQLTDIWNKAHKPKTIKTELPKTLEEQLPEGFLPKPKQSKTVLGNIKKINPKTKPENINQEEVAFRLNPKGKLVPAVRQKSGIYAPKEFEVFNFKDTGSKDLNFLNFAGAFDNLTADKGAGPMLRLAFENNKLIADRNEFITITSSEISKILKDNKMLDKFNKPKSKDGEIVFKLLEGKEVPEATNNHKIVTKKLRAILDELRIKANKGRELTGKDPIGYIKKYAPHIQKTSVWQELLTDKATISDNLDFIIPNEIQNPRFKRRYGNMMNKETNAFKLLDSYISSISNDIYLSPMIEQLKAINSVLSGRGMEKANNFINRYIRENLVRKPATIDNYVGLRAGSPQRKLVGKLIQARNLGALAGNIIWSIATQPASLGLTYMETGRDLFSGAFNYYTNKSFRNQIKNLPVSRIKSRTGVGTTLGGDIDRMTGKIYKTKVNNFNDFIALLSNVMEKNLTSVSSAAGYGKGKRLGLKGKELDIYADYIGQVTQSMYNPEARPLALNSMLVRLGFPFQTYAFEAWRHINTILGKTKNIPKTKKQRAISAINLIVATFVINYLHKKLRGRKLQTFGSYIPFIGNWVDTQISKLTKNKYQTGRSPIAPMEDVSKIREAIKSAIDDGDLTKLRKELIFWSLGLTGIGGAGQVNKIIDGIIADEKGYVDNIKGDRLFDIKGWDKVFAPIVGPYGTKAGKEYLETGTKTSIESIDDIRNRVKKMYNNGDFPSDEIATNYIKGELKKREDKIQKLLLTLPEAEFKQELKNYITNGDLPEDEAKNIALKYLEKYTKEMADYEDSKNAKNIYEIAPTEEKAITQIVKYAQAIGTDPIKAFDLLFKGEQVRKFKNGAIIVHRLPLKESESIKKNIGMTSKMKDNYRLDHTIPLQLGGDNSKKNLRLVKTSDWASYTPVENFLGKKLISGEIGGSKILGITIPNKSVMSLKEAKKLLTKFKDKKITAQEIYDRFDNTNFSERIQQKTESVRQLSDLPKNPTPDEINNEINRLMTEKKEVLSQYEPDYSINGLIDIIRDKLPFLRDSKSIGTEKALKREVKDAYNWTNNAIKEIDKTSIRDTAPIIIQVLRFIESPIKTISGNLPPKRYGGIYYTPLDAIENVTLGQRVTAHEMLHHFFKHYKIYKKNENFNNDWDEYLEYAIEKAYTNNKTIKYEDGSVGYEDKLIRFMIKTDKTLSRKGGLYEFSLNPKTHNLANERFAYLGSEINIEDIPESLRKYYHNIFTNK